MLQREDYPESSEDWYFILLSKCSNCGIEGEGRLDGQGSMWTYGGYVYTLIKVQVFMHFP
jgi:hypothetical protein